MPVEIKVVIPDTNFSLDFNDDDNDICVAKDAATQKYADFVQETVSATDKVYESVKIPRPPSQPRRRPVSAPPAQTMPLRLPVATNYDVDNEYDYIMDKALHAYKMHYDQEKASARQNRLRASVKNRIYLPESPWVHRQSPGLRPRPWSALPSKFDAVQVVGQANSNGIGSSPRKVLNVRTITLGPGTMDASNKKASNYQKRNQTSYSWYSQSFPNAAFLQQPGSNHRSRKSQSLTTSPAKMDDQKKGAGYEYDGGVFNPTTPRRDFFVIHPDWVSEAVTIQKLSLNERKKIKSQTWPSRRCRSAPPPKFRNPITWE